MKNKLTPHKPRWHQCLASSANGSSLWANLVSLETTTTARCHDSQPPFTCRPRRLRIFGSSITEDNESTRRIPGQSAHSCAPFSPRERWIHSSSLLLLLLLLHHHQHLLLLLPLLLPWASCTTYHKRWPLPVLQSADHLTRKRCSVLTLLMKRGVGALTFLSTFYHLVVKKLTALLSVAKWPFFKPLRTQDLPPP